MSNLISWYRTLQQDMDWAVSLRDSLQSVWPDFHTFRLVDVGSSTKMLQLRFDRGGSSVFFSTGELSDGERALLGLYMMRAALDKGLVRSVFIDEPDNFVGLKELQPWVLAMRELLDSDHQLVLISHNAEVLSNTGEESGRYVWRDDHVSPSRCGSLKVPSHLSIGEAIARGWIDGE